MKEKQTAHKMTPFPFLEKNIPLKRQSPNLYSSKGLFALRKLTLPSTRNQISFFPRKSLRKASKKQKSTYLKKLNLDYKKQRVMSSETSKHTSKYIINQGIHKNGIFQENNSIESKQAETKTNKRLGNGISMLERRSNHSLYKLGQKRFLRSSNNGLSQGCNRENNSRSPNLDYLKKDMGKLRTKMDRDCSKNKAVFLKEFNKFGNNNMYKKPKLKLIQREGQKILGLKVFPKKSKHRSHLTNERISSGLSCHTAAFSQMTRNSNTFKKLEKVRVFDVNSKWFKPKKQTNYSEKIEIVKGETKQTENKNKDSEKNEERKSAPSRGEGLMLSLRNKIRRKKGRRHLMKKFASGDKDKLQKDNIDLYSNLKGSKGLSHKSNAGKSVESFDFYSKIYR